WCDPTDDLNWNLFFKRSINVKYKIGDLSDLSLRHENTPLIILSRHHLSLPFNHTNSAGSPDLRSSSLFADILDLR
ncbi:10221_t:CDS:1, partial [Acaulospora morrowiae]